MTSSVETPHGRPCACPYTDDVSTFALTRVRVRPDNRAVVRLHGRAVVRPEIVRQLIRTLRMVLLLSKLKKTPDPYNSSREPINSSY